MARAEARPRTRLTFGITFGRGRIGIGETPLEGATESGHVYDYESTHNGLGWGDVMGDVVLRA